MEVYLDAEERQELDDRMSQGNRERQFTFLIYILAGIVVGSLANTAFDKKSKKAYIILDSIIGTIGAFMFGVFGSFALNEIGPSSYFVALIGAIIAVWISKAVRRSVERSRVEVNDDKNEGVKRNISIFNKGFLVAILGWILNSFIVGIILTVNAYNLLNTGFDSDIVSEFLRLSITNLFYEAFLWAPIIFISGGIKRKKGLRAAVRFVLKAFVVYLVVWGGILLRA